MKTLLPLCLCILLLWSHLPQVRAEELPEARHLIKGSREFSTAGGMLHFVVEGRRVVLLDAKDLQVFWFDSLESVQRVATSKDQSTVLVQVMRLVGVKRNVPGFSYSRLVLLQRDKSGKWRNTICLPKNRPQMEDERGRWIADLRTVEDEGRSAVVKFGEFSEEDPSRMQYDWRTIDLQTGNTLKNAVEPEREATTEVKVP